jgi:hypothetical protein
MEKALGSVRSAGKYAHELPFGRYVGSAIISTKTALDAFVKLLFNKIPTYEKGGKGPKAPTAAQNKEGTMTVRTIDSLEDFIKLIRDMARVVAGNIIGVAEAVSSRSASKILEFSAMFDVSAGSHGAALELAATTAFFGQTGSFAFSIRPGQAFADLVKVIGAKIIEVAAPVVNKVGGIVQNTKDAAQGIADKAKFKCDATCEAVFINTWNNGVKPFAQTFVSVFQTGATFVADTMIPAVQAIVSPFGRLEEIVALSDTVDLDQLDAGVIKTLAQTMTGALTTALTALKLHEAIALAAKSLLGGMACAPDKTMPIPKKYTNMYSTGDTYKIFAQDGIPMAGPNCEYAAIIGTKGVPQTVEGTVSWKVKPTGLFQWMEDMKTIFNSQVAAMALPTLKNVDFAFDFSDLSSIQTKFDFKLCHENQAGKPCSQVAANVGGSKKRRARRARTKLPLRKSECLLTLKDECGAASEQTEAGCSTCTQQQPSKLAFVTAGCTDSEVTAYCRGFAGAHTVAPRTRRNSDACTGDIGSTADLACSGKKLFSAVINQYAKEFDGIKQMATDIQKAFEESGLASIAATFTTALSNLPDIPCIDDSGCAKSCAAGKTCFCANKLADAAISGWLKCYERPAVGQKCTFTGSCQSSLACGLGNTENVCCSNGSGLFPSLLSPKYFCKDVADGATCR